MVSTSTISVGAIDWSDAMSESTIPTKYEKRGPGKFDDNIDEWTYQQSLDGTCEELGDTDSFGHYSLIEFTPEDSKALSEILDEHGDKFFVTPPVAAIVCADSQGFIAVTYYDVMQIAAETWGSISDDWDKFNSPDEFEGA